MKILLLGLGRANLAVARFLVERGDEVFLYEDNVNMLSNEARALIDNGEVRMYQKNGYELVIVSPGFPSNKEIIKKIEAQNIPVIDEIEFTFTQLKAPKIIAITGTNGKSTTAALINNILRSTGVNNFLGGNIAPGKPFSQALFMKKFDYYVLEVSSFQLMRTKQFHPQIAVITNIATDHLNWHSNFDEYKAAKCRIFANQDQNDYTVLNFEDELVRSFAMESKAQVLFFGGNTQHGVRFNSNFYYDKEKLFSISAVPLAGRHNIMNVAAAIAVTKILKTPDENIEEGVKSFKSIPHRLEDVGTIGGVRYINNSMCTNESAAIASFVALQGTKVVIVGGSQKGDTGHRYLDLLLREAKACVMLGANAGQIAAYFKTNNFSKFSIAADMDDAVVKARAFAELGDIILLNPGFASFGYFRNFEERGEAFKNAAYRG